MRSALAYIRWENIEELRNSNPITFNSRQERLHELTTGDRLWLVSRNPADNQYYFVACLHLSRRFKNSAAASTRERFGSFGVEADAEASHFFGLDFPAESLLRALLFETGKPIKYGANVGQALQTIRLASEEDQIVLDAAIRIKLGNAGRFRDRVFGLWTKCAPEFADYFLINWQAKAETLAFLLYDSAPALQTGAPVFVHSGKNLVFFAKFVGAQIVSGYRHSIEPDERHSERERVWKQYRASTLQCPTPNAFTEFWDSQDGVRSLFLFRELVPSKQPVPFKLYGRALEWGYPMGVGYRYLSFAESMLLLRAVGAEPRHVEDFAKLV